MRHVCDSTNYTATQQSLSAEKDDRHTTALTRKQGLHARMSHSTVCNTTVSTKKTRRPLPGALLLHTHTQVALYWRFINDDTHIHTPILMLALDCLHKRIFLLLVYRSVSLVHMRRYTQLTYLFHQWATSLLSRDGGIADCPVKYPGVERPSSS